VVADRAQLSKADAKRALTALHEIVLEELGNAQKVRIGGLVQLTVRQTDSEEAQGPPSHRRRNRHRPQNRRAWISALGH
jgi:nucleoid DNA-binding protein